MRATQSYSAIGVPAQKAQPTNHSYCILALGCKTSDTNTTLSHTYWLVGFAWKSAPPVTFLEPQFLAAGRLQFFPIHQLHSYVPRSYQGTLPRGSEQACVNELSLAELCRNTSFGSFTGLILRSGEPPQDITLPLKLLCSVPWNRTKLQGLTVLCPHRVCLYGAKKFLCYLERVKNFEISSCSLATNCSASELHPHLSGAPGKFRSLV